MLGISARRILLLATAAASIGWSTPTITSLQSSVPGGAPYNVTAITSATPLPNGFTLYINGAFNTQTLLAVRWFDTSTGVTTNFAPAALQATATQIVLTIPPALFQKVVASPVPVTITVAEAGGSSSSTFTINPPLAAVGPFLPAGTINQPYSCLFTTGGTAPFSEAGAGIDSLPPGLTNAPPSNVISGTPTQTGVFNFQTFAIDFWGNSIAGDDTIEIVDVPTVTSLLPVSSGVGAGNLSLTVKGTNFVDAVVVAGSVLRGSTVQWQAGNLLPLATSFISATQLRATVPSALLATLGTANISVIQPSAVTSPSTLPFNVLAPVISTLTPASVPAGSPATTLTVSGANFAVNAAAQAQSTIFFNGSAMATTFVDTGTLTTSLPPALLTTPGQYSVKVSNPGGTASNSIAFLVSGPVLSSLSTTSIPSGSPAFSLTVSGANYLAGSQISFRGTTLTNTTSSSTSLTATVPANLLTTPGQANVQVVNPAGSTSNILTFTVVAPSISTLSPPSISAGSGAFTLAVTGASFVSGAQISFNGTALTATFGSSTSLSTTVPASLVANAGTFPVTVINPGGSTSSILAFTVVAPSISALSPPSISAGSGAFTLAVTGASFVSGAQISFNGTALTATFGSSTSLSTTVPASLVANAGTFPVTVINPGGSVSAPAIFSVANSLGILTTSLPSGAAGSLYSATLLAKGGVPPYTWGATGLPAATGITPQTGVILGVPLQAGTFNIGVTLRDSVGATAAARYVISIAAPPVTISTGGLQNGQVGVPYAGIIGATGGSGPYAYTLTGGTLPDGLSLASGGSVIGTPTTAGTFTFSVLATDSTGATIGRDFTITILPATLTVSGSTNTTGPSGTPISLAFTGNGGVGPYRCTTAGTLPAGTTFSNCTLSGTPTTQGTFTFRVTVTDITGAIATKDVTVMITAPPPPGLTLAGTVGNGQVGVAYAGQLTAAGGIAPYVYAISGLPDGLSGSASGVISGTPATAGQYSISGAVTDSTGAKANATFSITIAPADLTITTASLPDGTVNTAFSAGLSAVGGLKPYTWSASGLPDGVTSTSAGAVSGTPSTAGNFTVSVTVKDATGASASARFSLTIAPATISITTLTVAGGTVGTPYAASFGASGGITPFTWSAAGLPAGLTMSAGGTISGTPTAPGSFNITVTVKDSAGASVSKPFPLTVVLPAVPPLNFTGISATSGALQQPQLQVTLGNPYPVDVVATLTLTFAPDSGPEDPAILFSTGGRTARITIPAGSTTGATSVGVQTGSVAGLITISAQLQAAGLDVTPTPAPVRTIRIAALAPVPTTVTATRTSTGFTLTIVGYVTDREITQVTYTFNAAPGSNLQTTSLTVPVDTLFSAYFGGSGAAPFGSQFTLTQPFTISGNLQAIVSVTVTMVNKIGQSTAVTVNLN